MFKPSLNLLILLVLLLAGCGGSETTTPTDDRTAHPTGNTCRGYLDEVLWGQPR